MNSAPRKDFLNLPAPLNYVPGLGRGASGFTTRSDIGPAREGPSEDALKAAAERKELGLEEEDPDRFLDAEGEEGLFGSGTYEKDDEEADKIYQQVDERMEARRKERREARERKEREEFEKDNPKISAQFADLKQELAAVTDEQWATIPSVGDLTGKNRRERKELRMQNRFYAVPDSVISSSSTEGALGTSIDPNADPGVEADAGAVTDIRTISAARDKMLGMKLDQASSGADSSSGATNIDPRGYLTSLATNTLQSNAPISDVRKARLLLESVVKTNPKHPPGWIAAARLEELADRMGAARNLIAKGCENCQHNEDVWLENMRLNDRNSARIIAAHAVRYNPESVRLWLEAMKLENDNISKKRVIRKALEVIPQSVSLWKEAVNLEENPEDAKVLLARAVELVPRSIDLWLALARLESDANARKVLNKARKTIQTSHEIWIAAARLEEQAGNIARVDKILQKGIMELQEKGGMLEREQWIQEAEKCETEGAYLTCHAIIKATIGIDIDEADRKSTWMDDAAKCIAGKYYETARAIYAYALQIFPTKKSIWRAAADLERLHGTRVALYEMLEKAIKACPHAEVLWLIYAKEKWIDGDIEGASKVLARAFEHNPDNEDIWLAAVKLQAENQQHNDARLLLGRAREEADTERVWIKSVVLERQLKNWDEALVLAAEGLEKYPKSPKLYMCKGQTYLALNKLNEAKEAFRDGVKYCPDSVPLWILLSRLEEQSGSSVRSRSILDRAARVNPADPGIWLERIRLERRAGNDKQAKALAAVALQECPDSGPLWTEAISMEPRTQRKSRYVDALRKCENDPSLIAAVARSFWNDRKVDKARSWFEKAIKANPDIGDSWGWLYKFLLEHGTEEARADLLARLSVVEPHHGEVWSRTAKDVSNFGKKRDEILALVANQLD